MTTFSRIFIALLFYAFVSTANADVYTVDGVAVSGYDPVSYFTPEGPQRGDDSLFVDHDGAKYLFANTTNREAFIADPARYLPAYGGYCALGTAMGIKAEANPKRWRIIDGTLYLNKSFVVQTMWKLDIDGYVRGADNNWPLIRDIDPQTLTSNAPEGITLGPQ